MSALKKNSVKEKDNDQLSKSKQALAIRLLHSLSEERIQIPIGQYGDKNKEGCVPLQKVVREINGSQL